DKFFGEESFAVIFENNAVDFRQHFFHARDYRSDLLFIRRQDFFAVNPNDLLLARNNPGFDDGGKIGRDRAAGGIDLLVRQQLPKLFSAAVPPNHSNDANMRGKFAQIAGDIG